MKPYIEGAKVLACLLALAIAGCAGAPSAPERGDATARPAAPPAPAEAASGEATAARAAELHFAAALDLMRRERYDDAAVAFTAMTRAYPDLAGPYLNLGIIYARTDRAAEAERALRAAMERNPTSAVAYNLLGLLYREAGRFEEARRAYEGALAVDGSYADAHLNLAILHDLYLQRPESALVHYELYRRAGGEDAMLERWIADLRQRVAERRGSAAAAGGPAGAGEVP